MNVWSKVLTALRGGVNEAGEAIIDGQALRILDQEIRDAAEELKQSRDGLAEIMARRILAEKQCEALEKQIAEHEGYAIKALEKDNEPLAREVAEKIAALENQLAQEQAARAGYGESVKSMQTAIRQAEQNLKRIRHQVDTVRATENVQRAQAAVAERHSGSETRMRTAMDSLERIREKQALKSARDSAARELSEYDLEVSLEDKLREAGIINGEKSADEILARLRKT